MTTVALGDLVNIIGGGTPSKRIPEYWNGTIPWASVKDLKSSKLAETVDSITQEGLKNSASNLIPKGTVITATRMALGRAAINIVDMAINQDLKALVCREGVDSRFILHFINANAAYIEGEGKGATVKGITLPFLKSLRVPKLALPEQKRIAAILDKADAIRRKRAEAIQLADDFLKSTFLDMFGDPVTNPKGWPEKSLNSIAELASGVTKGRKLDGKKTVHVPYMRVASVQDGSLDLSNITDIEVLPSDVEKYRLIPGDLLLTEGGDPDKLGRGTVWYGEIEDCIHQNHIFRVRPQHNIEPEFLSAQIGSARGKRYFMRSAKQTTGIASINMTQLRGFPALVPPSDLQKEYGKVTAKYKEKCQKLRKSEILLADLFNSLSQQAFRGEL